VVQNFRGGGMTTLVKYDAACRAVAAARTVDEAKSIRDKAVAMAAYARQAKNKDMEADAVEIRMRATRRLDQLRVAQKDSVGLSVGTRGSKIKGARVDKKPTLASQGIDKNLANQARNLGALSDDQFEEAITRTRKAVQRTVKIESDRTERLKNIEMIARGNVALGTTERFPIIYADPPWQYENPPIGATSRSIENHYPTMTLEEICALPILKLAADDAMLYLWATAPKLAECLKVIEAWGFEYRTNMIWDKEIIGMGYHVRNQHELLLVAKRGKIPPPKPVFYYEMIEKAYPTLPKIELFCRSPREGWAVWGNQAEAA